MSDNRNKLLVQIHNDVWSEELYSLDVKYIVDRVLTAKERQVLDLKIAGYSNEETAVLFKITVARVRRILTQIKSKFRNQLDLRVDNKHYVRDKRASRFKTYGHDTEANREVGDTELTINDESDDESV